VLISVRHLCAKTGGVKRKKAAKNGRAENKKALQLFDLQGSNKKYQCAG